MSYNHLIRCCRGNGSSSRRFQLHTSYVRNVPYSSHFFSWTIILLSLSQCRPYYRNRHIFHSFFNPYVCGFHWCLPRALDCWISGIICKLASLVRIGNDVSPFRGREGILRSYVQAPKTSSNNVLCFSSYITWFYCKRLHCFCKKVIHLLSYYVLFLFSEKS